MPERKLRSGTILGSGLRIFDYKNVVSPQKVRAVQKNPPQSPFSKGGTVGMPGLIEMLQNVS